MKPKVFDDYRYRGMTPLRGQLQGNKICLLFDCDVVYGPTWDCVPLPPPSNRSQVIEVSGQQVRIIAQSEMPLAVTVPSLAPTTSSTWTRTSTVVVVLSLVSVVLVAASLRMHRWSKSKLLVKSSQIAYAEIELTEQEAELI